MKRPTTHQYRCPTCGHRIGLSLTPKDVSTIKALLKERVSATKLAAAYGVTYAAIAKIRSGTNWKHVT